MKIHFTNGKLTAEAENLADVQTLLNLNKPTAKPVRKHKKHLFKTNCYMCAKECKKGAGLAKHMRHCPKRADRETCRKCPLSDD